MKKSLLRALEAYQPPEDRAIKNQYKRRDVYRCTHESHLHFNSAVSVYHVLKEKKCYPDGCIYFRWKCRKLDKGEPCPRKFKHVGRSCTSCSYFFDEKVLKRPEICLPRDEFLRFEKDLKVFEAWLEKNRGSLVEYSGRINSVKPRYGLKKQGKRHRVFFQGFLLNFCDGSIGNRRFADFVYVPVSSRLQGRFRFAKGDLVSFSGYLTVDRGNVRIRKIRTIEILERKEPCFWTESRARVAQRTGVVMGYQAEKCYACEKGVLLSVESDGSRRRGSRRVMFCLEGVEDPEWCPYSVQKCLQQYACSRDAEDGSDEGWLMEG